MFVCSNYEAEESVNFSIAMMEINMSNGALTPRAETATESQTMRGCAGEALDQSRRLQRTVNGLEEILCLAGLRERTPETGKDEAADPDDLRWIVNATNNQVRTATNQLEELTGILDRELK